MQPPIEDYKRHRPARSTLVGLEPIGLGTTQCESLESYLLRMAEFHRVNRMTIEQFVNFSGDTIYESSNNARRLDSPTVSGAVFAARLASLTSRPALARLGLGRFTSQLATSHSLRSVRVWCPDCFCDARDRGDPPHLPLLWSLVDYRVCHIHERTLHFRCSNRCRTTKYVRVGGRLVDSCSVCGLDLAIRHSEQRRSGLELIKGQESLEVELASSRALAAFVQQISSDRMATGATPMHRSIRVAIDRARALSNSATTHKAGTPRRIGRPPSTKTLLIRMGLSFSTLATAMKGNNRAVSLGVLLRITLISGVPIADIVLGNVQSDTQQGPSSQASLAPTLTRVRMNHRHDISAVKAAAIDLVNRGVASSMANLAQSLGVAHKSLLEIVPELKERLATQKQQTRDAKRQRTIEDLAARVREARTALQAAGLRINKRTIGKAINRCPYATGMRAAFGLAAQG